MYISLFDTKKEVEKTGNVGVWWWQITTAAEG
jgi:hypothetical protein